MTSHGLAPASLLEHLRPAWAEIDLTRLAANYRAVVGAAALPIMPVVKSDAYGHGVVPIARAFERLGAPLLAVSCAEEGAELRAAGLRVPVLVLAGFGRPQLRLMLDHQLTPVVSTPSMLEDVLHVRTSDERLRRVHLKLDTGMERLGLPVHHAGEACERLRGAGVALEGLLTHLASADEDPRFTEQQLDRFDRAVAELATRDVRPRWIHAANSAGLRCLRPSHTLARPGLVLYGVRPRPLTPAIDVAPVLSLRTRIVMVKDVATGAAVSYGGRWVARRPSRIATLPLGYEDGIPRTDRIVQGGWVQTRAGRAPIAGTICMDLLTIDVTDLPDVRENDEVVLYGDAPSTWDMADWAGSNAWQILTSVGARVPRVYRDEGRVIGVDSRFAAALDTKGPSTA